jgi:hypothetical protein
VESFLAQTKLFPLPPQTQKQQLGLPLRRLKEAPAKVQAPLSPFTLQQETNDGQAIDDLPVPAMPKVDSTAPESVDQTTASLAPKPAPGIRAATKGATPSFGDRVVQLQEYYDEHGHVRVPQGYKGGRGKNLGLWVKFRRVTKVVAERTWVCG